MPSIHDPREYLPLKPHVFHILLSVLDQERHGYGVIKDVAQRTGDQLVLGTSTLYAAIKRMVKTGLIEEAPQPSDTSSEGPQRRYYRATQLGRAVARAEAQRIRQLNRIVTKTSLLEEAS